MRTFAKVALGLLLALAVGIGFAQEMGTTLRVTVTNESSQVISPPLAVSHGADYVPFAVGSPASAELVALAEEGDASEFAALAGIAAGVRDVVVAAEPLAPGASVTLDVMVSEAAPYVTVLGMLVTTNDGFVTWTANALDASAMAMTDDAMMDDAMDADAMGDDKMSDDAMGDDGMGDPAMGDAAMGESMGDANMNSMTPHGPPHDGIVRVYDAGSERNTEACANIPGPPCGSAGARAADGAEGHVALHGGVLGVGDLDPAMWDWLNPVVSVTVER